MTANAINTENLTKAYRRVQALRNLNLQIPTGSTYALVGPNGAGKTTAIKILMNITRPTAGRAQVLGLESSQIAGAAFTQIGYISENQDLPDWMRVGAFIEFLRPFYPTWDREFERALIRRFDLPLDRKIKHLSRGMKMKAALASSLSYHPKLIVLDEPFSGLDPLVRDELIEGLKARAAQSTILISSHDLGEIETFATHVGYLEQGGLRFSGELATLTKCYREVVLTLEAPFASPAQLPPAWIQFHAASEFAVHFIATDFDRERTTAQVQQIFGTEVTTTITPMSRRSIVLAMAKAGRASKDRDDERA